MKFVKHHIILLFETVASLVVSMERHILENRIELTASFPSATHSSSSHRGAEGDVTYNEPIGKTVTYNEPIGKTVTSYGIGKSVKQ